MIHLGKMVLRQKRQINGLSIVLTGNLNPVIIQPAWLAYKGLILEEESRKAKVGLIHNELVKYELDWFQLQITKNRFEIRTFQEPYFQPLRDLTVGIFRSLSETPLTSLGINHMRHFTVEENEYFNLGNKIAPLRQWQGLLGEPRLLSCEFLQTVRVQGLGVVRVRIEPSDMLKAGQSFMLNINNHFDGGAQVNQRSLLENLGGDWSESFAFADRAESTIEQILNS
jgi:hypothetical protein